ncbi:MAG: AAA family ATPase [Acidimicrobiia bacterium]|nr:AAA family ATPase [Acidimicrobiia bacterium]
MGRIGPGAVKAFTPNWPGLPEGVHDIADNGQLIDRAGARAARDARQLEEWAGDPADPGDTLTAGWSTLLWADLTSPDDRPDETPALVAAGDGHVFYQGRHNDLHAPPGAGKTWLLYSVFAHALDDGHSIPRHRLRGHPRTFRQRLAALGVPADVISDPTRVRYVNVPARIGPDETDDIDQAVTALSTGGRHVVVGIDAMADALANDGADESSNVDVTRWHRRVIAHLLRSGCTVVTLDHIAKAADRPSNGARGAGAKLGLVDGVSYELKLLEGFSVGHAGKIALKIVKDRHGAIGPPRTHAFTAHINPDTDGHLAIRWEPASTTDRAPFRPTGYMERVSTWVAAQDAPPSQRQVDESVPGGSHYIRDALAHLVSEGYLKLTLGPRNAKNYEHVRPYSEATDPLTAAPRHDRGTTAAETRCDDRGTAAPPLIRGAGAAVALPRTPTTAANPKRSTSEPANEPPPARRRPPRRPILRGPRCTCAHEVEHTIDRDGTGRLTIRHDDWCPALQSTGTIVLIGGNP